MFQAFCIYRNTTKLSIFHCHKIRDDTAIATGGCPYQFGIYPLAACSPSYVKCAFGVPEEHPCDVGTVYDDRIHSCNWPDQVGRNIIRLSSSNYKCGIGALVPSHGHYQRVSQQ